MKKITSVISAAAFIFLTLTANASTNKCHYTLEEDSAQIQWQAYKTSEKLGVKGRFKDITIKSKSKTFSSIEALLKALKAEINLMSASTDNEARDKTLRDYFFGHLKSPQKALGSITKIKGQQFLLTLTMNGVTRQIPMTWQRDENTNAMTASGSVDLLAFHASSALDSLHNQCLDLHKGKDGVSKTWSEVEITLQGTVKKFCDSTN